MSTSEQVELNFRGSASEQHQIKFKASVSYTTLFLSSLKFPHKYQYETNSDYSFRIMNGIKKNKF